MDTTRRLWLGLAALLLASFSVLLWMGRDMHQQSPPLPARVVTESGHVVYTRADMERGRQVWQSIYYMQGLNLTPLHGHTALFGVYGMLGIGLMLFCLRGLKPDVAWHEGLAWFVARHWILPARAVTPQARAA